MPAGVVPIRSGASGLAKDQQSLRNSLFRIAAAISAATRTKPRIGTAAPDNLLSVNGSADKTGGGSWGTFSDGRLKNIEGTYDRGLDEVLALHPILYRYKMNNAMGIKDHKQHTGFVAQEVEKLIPEAVEYNKKGYRILNDDPILWAMLNSIK